MFFFPPSVEEPLPPSITEGYVFLPFRGAFRLLFRGSEFCRPYSSLRSVIGGSMTFGMEGLLLCSFPLLPPIDVHLPLPPFSLAVRLAFGIPDFSPPFPIRRGCFQWFIRPALLFPRQPALIRWHPFLILSFRSLIRVTPPARKELELDHILRNVFSFFFLPLFAVSDSRLLSVFC